MKITLRYLLGILFIIYGLIYVRYSLYDLGSISSSIMIISCLLCAISLILSQPLLTIIGSVLSFIRLLLQLKGLPVFFIFLIFLILLLFLIIVLSMSIIKNEYRKIIIQFLTHIPPLCIIILMIVYYISRDNRLFFPIFPIIETYFF